MRNRFKIALFLLTAIVQVNSYAQSIQEVKRYPIKEHSLWTVDGLNNIIISYRDRLTKMDTNGKILFDQSQKSLGKIDKIEVVNSLKLVGFSEAQQLLCFFDNSLTSFDKCVDLADYDLMSVSKIEVSGQSDKIWALDQVNSSLYLITMKGLMQNQLVKNIGGNLDIDQVSQMNEWNNTLFLLDKSKGIYLFDIYGTLFRFIELSNVKWMQYYNDYLICLKENELVFISLKDDSDSVSLPLSVKEVEDFYATEEFLFLRTATEIIKTKLNYN
ncbi:MAG: hypothetical protein M9916_07825 [Crocinitomicaceae bacterium]|nr:hypothetical protein [Crocinitomicaceae bacterium]